MSRLRDWWGRVPEVLSFGRTAEAGSVAAWSAKAPWPGPHLLLSPHPDDIALSIGGLLHGGLLAAPVRVVTLFGRSNYLETSGFQEDVNAVTRIRQAEETDAVRTFGVELVYHELSEAALRDSEAGDCIFAENCTERFSGPPELDNLVLESVRDLPGATIWAPLGLGCHRDHLLVQRTAALVAQSAGRPLVYYEDLPYAAQMAERAIERHALQIERRLRPERIAVEGVFEQKLATVAGYSSQITARHLAMTRRYGKHWDRDTAYERVWQVNH